MLIPFSLRILRYKMTARRTAEKGHILLKAHSTRALRLQGYVKEHTQRRQPRERLKLPWLLLRDMPT